MKCHLLILAQAIMRSIYDNNKNI